MKVPIEKIREVVTLEQVMDCFFAGGLAGYAGGGEYAYSKEIPGLRIFTLPPIILTSDDDALIFTDSYVANGPESGGMTIISLLYQDCTDTPIWMM